MFDPDDLVTLTTVPTAFEAEWIVGALKGMEIPAVTFGDALWDEFAVAQRVLSQAGGVRVVVPRGLLEEARAALVEIERNKPTPEELEATIRAAGRIPARRNTVYEILERAEPTPG